VAILLRAERLMNSQPARIRGRQHSQNQRSFYDFSLQAMDSAETIEAADVSRFQFKSDFTWVEQAIPTKTTTIARLAPCEMNCSGAFAGGVGPVSVLDTRLPFGINWVSEPDRGERCHRC
jgi:hypothetical protein